MTAPTFSTRGPQATPFQRGERDYDDGYKLAANPFPRGSKDYKQWVAGWLGQQAKDSLLNKDKPR
jgi:hypothetical protein